MKGAVTVVQSKTRFTPDDLLRMDEEGLFELVDGKLIEKQRGYLSNLTAGMVIGELRAHVKKSGAGGAVLPEQSFRCFPNDPDRIAALTWHLSLLREPPGFQRKGT